MDKVNKTKRQLGRERERERGGGPLGAVARTCPSWNTWDTDLFAEAV